MAKATAPARLKDPTSTELAFQVIILSKINQVKNPNYTKLSYDCFS